MHLKELSKEDKQFFKETYNDKSLSWDGKMSRLCEYTGKSERTMRRWLVELGLKSKEDSIPEQLKIAKEKKTDKRRKTFLITWAQNNTPVHKEFFKNLETYAKFRKAQILVVAGRYQNPTSIWSEYNKKEEFWAKETVPYLDYNRHDIHKNVSIMSDVKIRPTAVNPLTGLGGMSGLKSCVFGHPKTHLQPMPVLNSAKPKVMLTTGACTVKNYTDSKSGKKAEFHHKIGFAIIEIDTEDRFFVRQIVANEDGSFTDWVYNVDGQMITEINGLEGLILGDLHLGQDSEGVMKITQKIVSKLLVRNLLLHDVFNGYSINHHEMKDPFIQYSKEIKGTNSLQKEIDEMLSKLSIYKDIENVAVVRSNHDDFLDRWLKSGDWKKQPTSKNSRLYMKYSDILLQQHEKDTYNVEGVIPHIIKEKYPKFKTLKIGDSYTVKGIECGLHGDIGTNGSRGSIKQFSKINVPTVVGHYHSPWRINDALSVGTSTVLRMGYNKGASNWANAHVIIHEDGSMQHILFIDGKFTTIKGW